MELLKKEIKLGFEGDCLGCITVEIYLTVEIYQLFRIAELKKVVKTLARRAKKSYLCYEIKVFVISLFTPSRNVAFCISSHHVTSINFSHECYVHRMLVRKEPEVTAQRAPNSNSFDDIYSFCLFLLTCITVHQITVGRRLDNKNCLQ